MSAHLTEVAPACAHTQRGARNSEQFPQRVKPGSPAEERLAEQFLPLVRTVVGRLAMSLPPHVDQDDLFSSGLVGLLNAIRNFDPKGGSCFEAYARVRIRGAIFDELRRLDWVPRSVHDKARKVQAVIRELEQARGELPADNDVAKALKISLADYHELLDEIRPATFISLNSAAEDSAEGGGAFQPLEVFGDPSQEEPGETVGRRELAQVIAQRMKRLPAIQKKVLALYYFEDLRLREIAEVFHLTESRICQVHAAAILTLRAFLKTHDACPA